jgi:hypothetical protein
MYVLKIAEKSIVSLGTMDFSYALSWAKTWW